VIIPPEPEGVDGAGPCTGEGDGVPGIMTIGAHGCQLLFILKR